MEPEDRTSSASQGRPPEDKETAPEKLLTGVSLARAVPEERVPATPRPDTRAAYDARLRHIWRVAWGDRVPPEERWEWFHTTVHEGMRPLEVMGDALVARLNAELRTDVSGLGAEIALDGPLQNVVLLTSILADRVGRDQWAALGVLAGPLAAAVERFESQGEATPEEVVDLVLLMLAQVPDAPALSELAALLGGYLLQQEDRGLGYVLSLGSLADLARRGGDRLTAGFLNHMALRETWLVEVRTPDPLVPGDSPSRIVDMAATNLAVLLARRFQLAAGSADSDPALSTVLGDLAIISAVTANGPASTPSTVIDALVALDLPSYLLDNPHNVAAAMTELSAFPLAWRIDAGELAFLEALGAVGLALSERQQRVAARLFNAGVTLLRKANKTTDDISARVLLNGSGLEWALHTAPDLRTALLRYDGLNCAVNLLGALVELHQTPPGVSAAAMRLAEHLVELARWEPLQYRARPELQADLARIMAAGRRLVASRPEGELSVELLLPLVQDLLTELAGPDASPADDPAARAVGLAARVRAAFTTAERLDPNRVFDLLADVAARRNDATSEFVARYRAYAEPRDALIGRSPLRPPNGQAESPGFLTQAEFDAVAARLLRPVESIVPILRGISGLDWTVLG